MQRYGSFEGFDLQFSGIGLVIVHCLAWEYNDPSRYHHVFLKPQKSDVEKNMIPKKGDIHGTWLQAGWSQGVWAWLCLGGLCGRGNFVQVWVMVSIFVYSHPNWGNDPI